LFVAARVVPSFDQDRVTSQRVILSASRVTMYAQVQTAE
jgi:hypothetical protein